MNAQEYQKLAREHLQKHRPKMFRDLASKGQLVPCLKSLGKDAEKLEQEMERQYLERNPPPEEYQANLNHLAQARLAAQEIVMSEVILFPNEQSQNAIRRGRY
jgi:hypothetical protein